MYKKYISEFLRVHPICTKIITMFFTIFLLIFKTKLSSVPKCGLKKMRTKIKALYISTVHDIFVSLQYQEMLKYMSSRLTYLGRGQ